MELKIMALGLLLLCSIGILGTNGDDPYRFFTWNVTYGVRSPLGVSQQVILINGQFPGPDIYAVTNDNLIINVYNSLPEPFLLSWNGLQQRKNSWMDGVAGTNCPIPPGRNFTYKIQAKDQIGSYFYFPSLAFHKAAGGYGGIRILSRSLIPVPFDPPADDYTVLIGDWYKTNHTVLKGILDGGRMIQLPDGILVNGQASGTTFTVNPGKTYRLRISNVGLMHTLNFRIQGHTMKLVEVEGTHTQQSSYTSLDVHVGQSYSVLVTADQPAQDFYIAVSTRFNDVVLTSTAILHYSNSAWGASGPVPAGPTSDIAWSINQARSIRTNLTASGPRPNPQGSYHYGLVNVSRTIRLASSAGQVNGKQRYAVNSVSFLLADTPLKLADHLKIDSVFKQGSIPDSPSGSPIYLDTSVMAADFRAFVEIVFENPESIVQTWHLNGNNFFVVGMDGGAWSPDSRKQYNLADAVYRVTTQVYPRSWTAIYLALDNVGTLYKGTLSSGVEIAVTSAIAKSSKDWTKYAEAQFQQKVATLSKVNHKNFVNLLGYCTQEDPFTRMMVFEYAPNGTLYDHLHNKEVEGLNWGARLRIAMGIAYCLDYMHQLSPPVILQSIDSTSIHLTDDYAAKIADMELWSETVSVEADSGYPDTAMKQTPEKNDVVYKYGLILFEIISGRLPSTEVYEEFTERSTGLSSGEKPWKDIIDPELKSSYNEEDVRKIADVITSCLNLDPSGRPTMKEIAGRLREITAVHPDGATPKLSPLWWAELEIISTEGN